MINSKLRDIREDKDLTQEQLGSKLGVSASTISGWENNYDTMPLKRIIFFCNKYKFSLDYFFNISKTNTYQKLDLDINSISYKLKKLRKLNNKTQKYVSEKLNISTGTYCDYENGNRLISTISLYSLTRIYEPFSLDDIFTKNDY